MEKDGTVRTLSRADQVKGVFWAVAHVLVSRPVRPYEIAIGLAVFKAVEKSLGFHIGI